MRSLNMAGVAGTATSQPVEERADSIRFGRGGLSPVQPAGGCLSVYMPSFGQPLSLLKGVVFAERGCSARRVGYPSDPAFHHGGSPPRLCARALVHQTCCKRRRHGAAIVEKVPVPERGGEGGSFTFRSLERVPANRECIGGPRAPIFQYPPSKIAKNGTARLFHNQLF
jgi:hypothetical protein